MKLKPYLFLFFLIVILIFILGVRYGQRVEKNNKVVDYILSITPYPTYTPYPLTKDASASPTLFNLKK
ncbi:MAG: hypothetical protein AAB705_04020 [Patescibacteria group bacterium]